MTILQQSPAASRLSTALPIMLVLGLFCVTCSVSAQIQTNVPALKTVYKNDFYIGCLLSYKAVGFPDDPPVPGQSAVMDPNGGYLIKYHMNSMGPGNNMKPIYTVNITASAAAYAAASTQVAKDSADVHPAVQFNGDLIAQLNWAQRQGFRFRGHTLVWHSQTPGTQFFRSGYTVDGTRLTKEQMTQRMGYYIKEVIRQLHERWPGLLYAVNVVNEAVNDDGTDRSSGSEWYQTFGDNSYIMKAFEFSRQYTKAYNETQIKLYYNDYNTSTSSKANGITRVCGPIFRAGLLDGIGMQEHDGIGSPTPAQWIASYAKFDTVCSEMSVTELDVNPGTVTALSMRQQANQYACLFKCFVERSARSGRGKIVSVSKDGLNDASAFVANASLWTGGDTCKLAFYSVVNVGVNYNALDSIIRSVDTLHENRYTTASWAKLQTALASAITARNKSYSYVLPADTLLGLSKDSLAFAVNGLTVTGVTSTSNVPVRFGLSQNYPNPFNPVTRIMYSVPQSGYVTLKVYNLLGEEVALLVDDLRQPGTYSAAFDGKNCASGVYLYQLKSNTYVETKKLVLMK